MHTAENKDVIDLQTNTYVVYHFQYDLWLNSIALLFSYMYRHDI